MLIYRFYKLKKSMPLAHRLPGCQRLFSSFDEWHAFAFNVGNLGFSPTESYYPLSAVFYRRSRLTGSIFVAPLKSTSSVKRSASGSHCSNGTGFSPFRSNVIRPDMGEKYQMCSWASVRLVNM